MAEAIFLDGPMAARVQTLPGDRPADLFVVEHLPGPPIDWSADTVPYERVEYRLKPNRLSDWPKWAYALDGSKVGDQVVTIVPYSLEADERVANRDVFHAQIVRTAREAMEKACADEGLVPARFRELWRGTYGDMMETLATRSTDSEHFAGATAASNAWASLGRHGRGMVMVVFEAIAVLPGTADADK